MIRAHSSSGLSHRSLIAGLDEAVTFPPWISQRFCIRFRSGPLKIRSSRAGFKPGLLSYGSTMPSPWVPLPLVKAASTWQDSNPGLNPALEEWIGPSLRHCNIFTFKELFLTQCGWIIRDPTPAAENTSNQLPHYPDLHLRFMYKRPSWRINLHLEQLTHHLSKSIGAFSELQHSGSDDIRWIPVSGLSAHPPDFSGPPDQVAQYLESGCDVDVHSFEKMEFFKSLIIPLKNWSLCKGT